MLPTEARGRLHPTLPSRKDKRSTAGIRLQTSSILRIGVVIVSLVQILHIAQRLHLFTSLAATIGADSTRVDLLHLLGPLSGNTSRHGRAAPYEIGTVCIGVNVHGKNLKCIDRIHHYVKSQNVTIAEAANTVADEYPKSCARCKRSDADGNERYWRFDSAAPPIVAPGVTHFLKSIPSEARLPPPSENFNLSAYLAERWAHNNGAEFLFEYNPSLVLLPEGATRNVNLPDNEEAAYLMSLRVTPANGCFPQDVYEAMPTEQWEAFRGIEQNYVALALLRPDLSIIPGYEVVIDFFVQTDAPKGKPWNPWFSQSITDYRLFATNDRLYFNINGLPVHVAPFALISDDNVGRAAVPDGGQILPNRYGGGFHVVLFQNLTSIWEGGLFGKNYAMYQTDELLQKDEALVELGVSPVHKVSRVSLTKFYMMKLSDVWAAQWPKKNHKKLDDPNVQRRRQRKADVTRRRRNIAIGNESESEALGRSFATVDEYWFQRPVFKEFSHGGACCVQIKTDYFMGGVDSEEPYLLVGIAHSKIQWRPWYSRKDVSDEEKRAIPPGSYISFYYAFEPRTPHTIKAASGYFCLGYGNDEEERINPYLAMARKIKMNMNSEDFDCPMIHYVSSVTEKAGDNSKMIVSYGINDCVPRIVEMDKHEVAKFISYGPDAPNR